MKIFRLKKISKNYAACAALYRRVARTHVANLDYSEAMLRQLHTHESTGHGEVDKSKNGYAYGKWLVDLSMSMMIEDIKAGNACKAEFLSTTLERLHNAKKLKSIVPGELFAWR